ncbi:lytic transglycosylase [Celeribacter neptunius]|uniref:Transglycosylase SLT domain-containing protein n=1 Tax=Celeribacter neptunius TaxID=588602 RepID=A0A1I3K2C2_9RHOB|nr:lytic transglycosylase [Celeribacter neptunius]SFI66613.1 hypothetical protein SAMN04487991_0549 [Celeribacter neptunius]
MTSNALSSRTPTLSRRAVIVTGTAALCTLAACGARNSVPANPENACAIIRDKPQYYTAMRKSERKWGVPVSTQMAFIYHESGFRANARPPKRYTLWVIPKGRASSARGYVQALDGTWDDYRNGPGRRGASRSNIFDAADFLGWYVSTNNKALGISNADARNSYLAYHEGRTGYRRGSHQSKAWLIGVADQLAARAARYKAQLASCR